MWSALVISHQSGLVMSTGWVVKSVRRGSVEILNKFQTFSLSHMLSEQLTNFKPSSLSHMLLSEHSHTSLTVTLILFSQLFSQQLSQFFHSNSYTSLTEPHTTLRKSHTQQNFAPLLSLIQAQHSLQSSSFTLIQSQQYICTSSCQVRISSLFSWLFSVYNCFRKCCLH